jgi:hypothetical protein
MLGILIISFQAWSGELGIITVTGTNEEPTQLTLQQLESMPVTEFETETPWTEGKTRFKGVRLQMLMEQLGVDSDVIRVKALNQYHADVHWKELSQYPVIIAYEMNGEPMSVRDKGPFWLMFPMSDFPELNTPKHHISMVWQVSEIEAL